MRNEEGRRLPTGQTRPNTERQDINFMQLAFRDLFATIPQI